MIDKNKNNDSSGADIIAIIIAFIIAIILIFWVAPMISHAKPQHKWTASELSSYTYELENSEDGSEI